MNDFLNKIILNNKVENYLYVAATILVALFIKRIISRYLATLLFTMVNKAGKTQHKAAFINMVVKPLDFFLVVLISFIAVYRLNFPEVLNFKVYKISFETILDSICSIVLIISLIRLVIKIIDFLAMILQEKALDTHDQTDNQLIVFFKDFFKVILVLIGVLLVLRFAFHKDVSNLLTGLSLVGAAIALATKESLENLIASFIIFFDKPFTTGDIVKVNGFTGNVEKIGLRSTRIRTDIKTYITVPNKQMVDTILDNITLRTQRKVEVRLEIGLSTSTEKLKKLTPAIKNILAEHKEIVTTHVYLMETGKAAHIFAVDFFTVVSQPFDAFNAMREDVNIALIDLLNNMEIEFAAASADINVKVTTQA